MFQHKEVIEDGQSYDYVWLDGELFGKYLNDPLEPYDPKQPERNLLYEA